MVFHILSLTSKHPRSMAKGNEYIWTNSFLHLSSHLPVHVRDPWPKAISRYQMNSFLHLSLHLPAHMRGPWPKGMSRYGWIVFSISPRTHLSGIYDSGSSKYSASLNSMLLFSSKYVWYKNREHVTMINKYCLISELRTQRFVYLTLCFTKK